MPRVVEFPGFAAQVRVTGVAQMSWDAGGEGQHASYMVRVQITPVDHVSAGVMLVDGQQPRYGVSLSELVVDGILPRATSSQRP